MLYNALFPLPARPGRAGSFAAGSPGTPTVRPTCWSVGAQRPEVGATTAATSFPTDVCFRAGDRSRQSSRAVAL
jgi:hypothetical protein